MKQDFLCVSFINHPEFYEIQGLGIVGGKDKCRAMVVRFSKFLFLNERYKLDFSLSFLSTSHSRRKVVYVTGNLK